MNVWLEIKKKLRSPKKECIDWRKKYVVLIEQYDKLKEDYARLSYGNEQLKKINRASIAASDNPFKRDLNEAINIIVDYQKTLYRLQSPDPNVQRANELLNRYGVQSERIHEKYRILVDGKEITMGREY